MPLTGLGVDPDDALAGALGDPEHVVGPPRHFPWVRQSRQDDAPVELAVSRHHVVRRILRPEQPHQGRCGPQYYDRTKLPHQDYSSWYFAPPRAGC